jgi:hypothetical protein
MCHGAAAMKAAARSGVIVAASFSPIATSAQRPEDVNAFE